MEIIPAIIPQSFEDLEDKVDQVNGLADFVQVDICDGKFTPDKSWPIVGDDDGKFPLLVEEKEGLPHWDDVDYEIHLMTKTPSDEVGDWAKAGATRILVPIEAGSDAIKDIIDEWGSVVEIGLVANMETSVEVFESYLDKVETIQLMSIDVIGHQGEPFDEKVIDKIKRLREIGYKHKISIDGGINLENAKSLIEAGADRLIVGSAIWGSDNPVETLKKFKNLGAKHPTGGKLGV
ncbi:MAG TPA: hypothetical protein VJI33_00230 [Candidatus Paceibacterota bacterium]